MEGMEEGGGGRFAVLFQGGEIEKVQIPPETGHWYGSDRAMREEVARRARTQLEATRGRTSVRASIGEYLGTPPLEPATELDRLLRIRRELHNLPRKYPGDFLSQTDPDRRIAQIATKHFGELSDDTAWYLEFESAAIDFEGDLGGGPYRGMPDGEVHGSHITTLDQTIDGLETGLAPVAAPGSILAETGPMADVTEQVRAGGGLAPQPVALRGPLYMDELLSVEDRIALAEAERGLAPKVTPEQADALGRALYGMDQETRLTGKRAMLIFDEAMKAVDFGPDIDKHNPF